MKICHGTHESLSAGLDAITNSKKSEALWIGSMTEKKKEKLLP